MSDVLFVGATLMVSWLWFSTLGIHVLYTILILGLTLCITSCRFAKTTRLHETLALGMHTRSNKISVVMEVIEWGDGAGILPVPGRPTDLDNSRAMAYCACSRCR